MCCFKCQRAKCIAFGDADPCRSALREREGVSLRREVSFLAGSKSDMTSASPYHSAFQYYSYTLRGAAFGGLYTIINFQGIQKPAKEAGNLFPQIFGEMSLHTCPYCYAKRCRRAKTIISHFPPLSMVEIKKVTCRLHNPLFPSAWVPDERCLVIHYI